MRQIICALVFVLCAIGVYGQQQITGTIYEDVNGVKTPLPFANVFIPGTTRGVTSDFDGKFSVAVYETDTLIKVSYMGYNDVVKRIDPTQGDLVVDVVMSADDAAQNLEGVTVTAKKNMANENMLLLEQKKAVVVKESIGAKQLSILGVSDAAAATTKISGVNKTEGSGDIYIRGLGDRYLTTTMNALPIPSDDVEKKNIDLKLFSTDVIDNISISKTYSSNRYADQTSGQIDITSKAYTSKISVGVKTGINTNVMPVWNEFKATQNYNDQKWGFYSNPNSDLEDAVQNQSWNTVDKKAPFKYGFSLMGGKKWDIDDSELSLFASLSTDVKSGYHDGIYKTYPTNVLKISYTDTKEYSTTYNTTGLLNFAFTNNKFKLKYNGLWVARTKDELIEAGRNGEAYYYELDPEEEGVFVRDQNIKQTNLFVNQLIGKLYFDNNDIDWAVGYNYVKADEPNRIRNIICQPTEDNDLETPQFSHSGGYDQRKSSQAIVDKEFNGFLTDQHRFIEEEDKSLFLNTGLNFRNKKRDFNSDAVGAFAKGIHVQSIDNVDEALNDESMYVDSITLKTRPLDVYNAELLVYSAFLNTDFQYKALSGNIGVRYEHDYLFVEWDVQNSQAGDVEKKYDNILPSLNLKYSFSEKNFLRFAASKTVTLPEFKELAPFEYVTPYGRVIKGQPDLESSYAYNLDLKWEMFLRPKELISVTAFGKQIFDPINRALTRGSSGYYWYANTGEKANVYGVEIEGRLNIFSSTIENRPSLRFTFNMTKMWAEQDLIDEFQYNHKTTCGLQGAASFIGNGALIFSDNKEKEFKATLSANYSSDKIYALGAPRDASEPNTYYDNEIIEKGFATLDLVLKKKFTNRISAKLSAKNLLNPTIEWNQDVDNTNGTRTEVVESYQKGIEINLGVTINLN